MIFFLGCSLNQSQQNKDQTPTQPSQKTITQKPKTPVRENDKAVSGMLRGIITSQQYDKNKKLWVYGLKVIDIANDSLKEVEFFYKKRVLDLGDLVYVLFKDKNREIAKDVFLIKKEYRKIKKVSSKKEKFKKRTKSRQTPWIGLPKVSTIKLK